MCWEDFEKLIFYPVTESTERICLCSPGFVSPMRGRTWLGAALVLGVQLRGKETCPRPPSLPSSDPLNYPQGRGFPPVLAAILSAQGSLEVAPSFVEFLPQQVWAYSRGRTPISSTDLSSGFNVFFVSCQESELYSQPLLFFSFATFVPEQSGIVQESRLQILRTARVPDWHETHPNFRWFLSKHLDFKSNTSSFLKCASTRM